MIHWHQDLSFLLFLNSFSEIRVAKKLLKDYWILLYLISITDIHFLFLFLFRFYLIFLVFTLFFVATAARLIVFFTY